MARITVEDCIDKFPSRFELVLIASNRARKLHSGETPTLDKDNDKNTVIALREIAQETLTIDQLKNDLIEEYQTTTFTEDEDIDENSQLNDNFSENENNLILDDNLEEVESSENITSSEEVESSENITSSEENIENENFQASEQSENKKEESI